MSLQRRVRSIFNRLSLPTDPLIAYLLIAITAYSVVFSYFTITRMYALGASAWDLGNYNQALYSFDFGGRLFVWTSDIIANPSGSLFGVHFSPVFYLIAVPYIASPRPETLLVIQSVVIAIGAIPVFWLARNTLQSPKLALLFSLSYLASPALMGVNWFDFHPEAFIPTSLLFVVYFFLQRKWTKLTLSVLFSLSIMGEVGLLVSALGAYFLIRHFFTSRSHEREARNVLVAAGALMVGGLVWTVFANKMVLLINPGAPYIASPSPSWSILGAPNVVNVPAAVVLNPIRAIGALLFERASKGLLIFVLLGSFAFLSLRKPLALLPSLVWLVPSLLSNYSPYYLIGFQYPALVIPFTAYASIEGAKKLLSTIRPRNLAALLLIAMATGLSIGSPLVSYGLTSTWVSLGVPSVVPRDRVAIDFAGMIPPQAPVLADEFIFPLVSSRVDAYTIPSSIKHPTISFLTYIDELVGKTDYIILNLARSPLDPSNWIILSRTETEFGVLGYSHDILLLKRGYHSAPVVFDPIKLVLNYQNLVVQNSTIVVDNGSVSGKVLKTMGNGLSGLDFWTGPHVLIAPGEYRVTVWLKSQSPSNTTSLALTSSVSPVGVRNVIVNQEVGDPHWIFQTETDMSRTLVISNTTVGGSTLQTDVYRPFGYDLTVDEWGFYDFRGTDSQSNASILLDRIEIDELRPLAGVQPLRVRFEGFEPFTYDSSHSSYISKVAGLIPPSGILLIQGELLSLVVHQGPVVAVLLPCCENTDESLTVELDRKIASADYIALDSKLNMTIASVVTSRPAVSSDFGVYAREDGVTLLVRGYTGPILYGSDSHS